MSDFWPDELVRPVHKRSGWARAGTPFFGASYSLSCVCGWRSHWTRLHYIAELAFTEHCERQEELFQAWSDSVGCGIGETNACVD